MFLIGEKLKAIITFLIFVLVLIWGCDSKLESSRNKPKTDTSQQTSNINNFRIFYADSVKYGRKIYDSFLSFKFYDSKKLVERKTMKLLKSKKLSKRKDLYQNNHLIYKMKFKRESVDFDVKFKYFENKLYCIELTYFSGLNINPPIYPWHKEKIIEIYKEKYKRKWYHTEPIFNGLTEDYENLDGTRYLCLAFSDRDMFIIYKDIYLENLLQNRNIQETKGDI